jgi:hypothetical protein
MGLCKLASESGTSKCSMATLGSAEAKRRMGREIGGGDATEAGTL